MNRIKKLFSLKKQQKENRANYQLFLVFLMTILSAFIIYYFFSNILLVILTALSVLVISFLFFSKEIRSSNYTNSELVDRVEFYKKVVIYSSLYTSYKEGYIKAYEDFKICSLKEKIKQDIENNETFSLTPLTMTREEVLLLDNLYFSLNNDELTDNIALEVSSKLLDAFIKKTTLDKKDNILMTTMSLLLDMFVILIFLMNCK